MSSLQKNSIRKSKLLVATGSGLLTILLWSSLAVMTTSLPNIPRFQLLWFGFGEAFIIGSIILALTGRLREMAQPFAPWFTAFCGIFFFHLFYFVGLNFAPPAKVTLLSYLWPTMLVVCIAFLSKKHFHIAYLLGALMGLIGTSFIMPADKGSVLTSGVFFGYFLGCLCAIVWTIYSIFNRKYTFVPTGMIIGVCGGISLVSMAIHFAFEPTIMPQSFKEMAIILYLGCGPMGIAFLAWDYATKNANLSLMGSLSYLAPLLSTLWLVIAGRAPATVGLLVAVILIVGGAVVATYPLKKTKES
ncbi:DMT family transporter [Commensalibacter papalotli (ex Botero et al. 2024)]|uniref:Permease of the drug/metabolite transporter (DMT) superfamily (RhaT) (PDB:5I20) n=1 Tax=Commensalibacter papalotli (ex Botero et al. 2024) TaxID=2972766 RepID=A0ABN8WCZ4_9PROT|nr:EamA family transporter [Commensalibacter papalotli (ex Botero et al. 2024)]CAI3931704.1 Permease of the drug/metabolite transporter (DMT) superfamily (RhaT) (PDB:5I20) [Commensalibacter papalotli (ex Botero et al. 2024)]CAI3943989.1 Permease of the drug/metabolite transporter (DMT) superfamily (RhaT) (PDB:5I20) [Commensalibacter papalotli (ex Botero et al. 2024)]